MGKYSKQAVQQRKVLTAAIAALGAVLVVLLVVLVCLEQDKTPEETMPGTTEGVTSQMKELLVEKVTQQGDTMLVETTYGMVKYPYAFSDLIGVEAETFETYAALEFSAEINGEKYKLYTLVFNGEEGIPVGTLEIDDESYTVTAVFHDVTGLDDDSMITFSAAQEAFNDVVNSLSENRGFTAED